MTVPNPSNTHTNARILHYLEKDILQVASMPLFPRKERLPPSPREKPDNPKVSDPERSARVSKERALSRIQQIVDCNHFDHFCVLSLDGTKIDRYDPKIIYSKLRNFLDYARRRYGFSYLLVPDYHEPDEGDARRAIHLHVLCILGNLPKERAVYADGSPVSDRAGRPVFHLPNWKWGHSYVTPITGSEAGTYCKQKVLNLDKKVFGKWYLSSHNLIKGPSVETLDPISFQEFRDPTKLEKKQQSETMIYSGLSVISEEIPRKERPLG